MNLPADPAGRRLFYFGLNLQVDAYALRAKVVGRIEITNAERLLLRARLMKRGLAVSWLVEIREIRLFLV